jgi:hypothetical protein
LATGAALFYAAVMLTKRRGPTDREARRAIRAAVRADLTLAEPVDLTVDAAGVRTAGEGFGTFNQWHPGRAASVSAGPSGQEYALLPTLNGGALAVPRRAFASDAAFMEFVEAAESFRAGLPIPLRSEADEEAAGDGDGPW